MLTLGTPKGVSPRVCSGGGCSALPPPDTRVAWGEATLTPRLDAGPGPQCTCVPGSLPVVEAESTVQIRAQHLADVYDGDVVAMWGPSPVDNGFPTPVIPGYTLGYEDRDLGA